MLHHGASKNKIYDSELFIKKWKIDQHTPKAQRKFFSPMNLDPPQKKNLFFYIFFSKDVAKMVLDKRGLLLYDDE